MNKVWLAVLGLGIFSYGCGPQLAQSPYGQKETQWEGYVKQSYPSWTPAKTIPPVEQQSTASTAMPAAADNPADSPAVQEYPAVPVGPAPAPVLNSTPAPVPPAPAAANTAIPPIKTFNDNPSPEPNLLPLQKLSELPDNRVTSPIKEES